MGERGGALFNFSFSGLFSHLHSRILLREGEDCYSLLSVQKNEKTTVEGKREMKTALFPRSLHIYINQILRDIWGGSTLTT